MKKMKTRLLSGCVIIIMVIGFILVTLGCEIVTPVLNPGKWDQSLYGTDVFGK